MSEKDKFFRFCSVFDEKIENRNEQKALGLLLFWAL